MAARPGIRRCDIEAAKAAELMFGRRVKSLTRDNVTIHFVGHHQAMDSDIDSELATLEARHGQG